MEITIDRGELLAALSIAKGVVEVRNTLPILGNVLLTAERDRVTLSATDLVIQVRRSCSAKVKAEGAVTVPAKKLLELVNASRSGELTIKDLGGAFVEVKSGRSKVKLLSLPASDYPAFPTAPKGAAEIQIQPSVLTRALELTGFCVSTDETRLHLCGILLSRAEDGLRFVSTDGHRLSRYDTGVKLGDFPANDIIVPKKALALCRDAVGDLEEPVTLLLSPGAAFARCGNVEISMRLIEAEFPRYDAVIPKSIKTAVELDKQELLTSLRRAAVVASDRSRGVELSTKDSVLTVSSRSQDHGEASEEIEVRQSGSAVKVGLNGRYLTEVLSALSDGAVEIGLIDEGSPVVIRSPQQDDFVHVVMAMRL